MHVEDAKAPRRQHQHAGAREEHAHERDRQLALLSAEPRREHRDDPRRAEHADEGQRRDNQRDETENRSRHLRGLSGTLLRAQARIDRDERSGERALAEQILEKIGNPERGVERIGRVGLQAEEVRECPDAQQAKDPAREDTSAHRRSGMPRHADGAPQRVPGAAGE